MENDGLILNATGDPPEEMSPLGYLSKDEVAKFLLG